MESMSPQLSRIGLESVKLKIGTLYCDDHQPTNIQVIAGIWDYLKTFRKSSTLYMFGDGPSGLMTSNYEKFRTCDLYDHPEYMQMLFGKRGRLDTPEALQKAEKNIVRDLQLDGLVVIGGDDATVNAYALADYFRCKEVKTCVICCPNNIQSDTIHTDLDYSELPFCYGFRNVRKAYTEMICDIQMDAQSRGDCYHFVRLTGHAASQITLECALRTHPNIAFIGEELSAKKLTLKNVRDQIVDVICKRSILGYNYGVILIPEGLINFIPDFRKLYAELHKIKSCGDIWMEKLSNQSRELMEVLPLKTRNVLIHRSCPRGNPLAPEIDTEWTLFQMVKSKLEGMSKEGFYNGDFKGLTHYTRCCEPDMVYKSCYKLGYAACDLIRNGRTGLLCSVQNLDELVDEWSVNLILLASLVDWKRRNGESKLVIKKTRVALDGILFQRFEADRDMWVTGGT